MDYWPLFESFIIEELKAHGPDPQLQLLLELAPDVSDVEKMWLIGTYCAHHCVASAWAVYLNFRPDQVLKDPNSLLRFLERNWAALPVRQEMHSHRMLEKRWACLIDAAIYATGKSWQNGSYEKIWNDFIESVSFFNRYLCIKAIEMMRRTVRPDLILSDIRAQKGWSPRAMIALLYPEVADTVGNKRNNSFETVWYAEEYATRIRERLKLRGIELSYYQLQVLLCNSKQMIEGRVAPGSGIEAELNFIRTAEKNFTMSHVYDTRKRIYDHRYLSEVPGWQGLQKDHWRRKVKELHDGTNAENNL